MDKVYCYSLNSEGGSQLNPYFKVREFACKDGSDPIFISNELINILLKIRTHFNSPVTINSGYRTVSYNAKIGGAALSQHTRGLAADIVVKGVAPSKVADYAETLLNGWGGVGRYSTFTHVDVRLSCSRWNG